MYKIIELPLPDKLLTGIDEIDIQHKKIFQLAEKLVNSIGEHLSDDIVRESLDFLGRYIGVHFQKEEELQLKMGYPGYAAHKEMHEEFLETFIQLKLDFSIEGNTEATQKKMIDSIVAWTLEHINEEDFKMVAYFKQL